MARPRKPSPPTIDPSAVDYLCKLFCFTLDGKRATFGERQPAFVSLPEPERDALRETIEIVANAALEEFASTGG